MRTEKEILKDFEKLGYQTIEHHEFSVILKSKHYEIDVSECDFGYRCFFRDSQSACIIDIEEHKLLHELFEIWGWL